MFKPLLISILPVALLASTGALHASPSCESNFSSKGNVLSGRVLQSHQDFPLTRAAAFEITAAMITATGGQIQEQHAELGIIRAVETPRNSRPIELKATVVNREEGGVRVSLAVHLRPGQMVPTGAAREEICKRLALITPEAGSPNVRADVDSSSRGQPENDPELAETEAKRNLEVGQTVVGVLDARDEIDRFPITGLGVGEEIFLELDNNGEQAELRTVEDLQTIRLVVREIGTGAQVLSTSRDMDPEGPLSRSERISATDVFEPAAGKEYEAVIERLTPADPARSYRLRLGRVDRSPESLGPRIVLDEVVEGEALDHSRDVDVFTFEGAAGQELELYLQMMERDGRGSAIAVASVFADGSESSLADAGAVDVSEPLDRRSSGPFVLPEPGTYRVVVSRAFAGHYIGPYRFRVRVRG